MLKELDKTVGIIEVVMPSEETFINIFFLRHFNTFKILQFSILEIKTKHIKYHKFIF